MYDNHSVLPGVGGQARVDHVCIQAGNGMLIGATTLFVKLGYIEDIDRRKSGDWGEARFLEKPGSIPVQLTRSSDETTIAAGENHVAIAVENPYEAAVSLVKWLNWAGVDDTAIEEYGRNYFVMVPVLLVQPLEFVPLH